MENIFAELSFGQWLKRRRKAAGFTQEQLALQISCSTSALKKLEAEVRRPSAQMVEQLSQIFDIPQNEEAAFLRFARGDWRFARAEVMEDAPWRGSSKPPRSNLPTPTTSLVGREKEIVDVREYLRRADIRLITLIGPPGIGKTRLSLEVAHASLFDFPDGVFFVPLAPLNDPNLIALTIAQSLGFAETELEAPLERLKAGIGEEQLLLVLDNLEHIIEGAASLVSDLLSACPRLKILTTSREAQRVPGEWLYSLPTLKIPTETQLPTMNLNGISQYAALTLFAERARAVRSDFVIDADNLVTVTAICARLDGLPLAIELIAARIRWMSPQALLAKLNDQFILSADGMRAVSARQKTLRNAISWSYNLLSPEEQNLFARLSIFSGGFTLDAAEAVFSRTVTNKSVADLIALLVDKSLLQPTPNVHGEPRLNMLVTVQQFAMDHLRHGDEETKARNWHLAHFLDLAETADKEIHGPNQVEWIDRLEAENDNYRAALDWCMSSQKTEAALRLLDALHWSWHVRGHYSEARSWFAQIRAMPVSAAHPALYARLLNQHGRQCWVLGELQEARSVLNESQAIWLQLGVEGEQGLADALDALGMVANVNEADIETAKALFERSLELYQKHGDRRGVASVMLNLGWLANDRSDHAQALSMLEQSLGLFNQLGDVWGISRVALLLGRLFLKQRVYEKALEYLEQTLSLNKSLHFDVGIAIALGSIGDLYRHQGDYDRAECYYKEYLAVSREHGVKEEQAGAFFMLGLVALHRSDYLLAERYFRDYYSIRRNLHKIWGTIDFLEGLSAVAAGLNQFDHAAKLYGALQALRDGFDLPDVSYDRVESESLIQIAREQLGDERFETLAAEGRAMTMEQAVEFARQGEE